MNLFFLGANVQKGRFLDTPLHAAAQKDCPEIIRVLLDFGANINTRNLELQRPVETAPPSSAAEAVLLLYEGNVAQFSLTGKREGMGSGNDQSFQSCTLYITVEISKNYYN